MQINFTNRTFLKPQLPIAPKTQMPPEGAERPSLPVDLEKEEENQQREGFIGPKPEHVQKLLDEINMWGYDWK